MTFAADLEAARAAVIHDPADAVIHVIAEHFGLESDPLEHRGYQSAWDGEPMALAARVLYHGVGLTQQQTADRLGVSTGATAVYNTTHPPNAEEWELDFYDDAMARVAPGPISFRQVR